ncbi:MAG: cache domain-containing protein [Candidatus Omnitrophica bacterium]|nr:cache domain-containing protein [Candidatus Omnitrophota bacterium]
MKKLVMFVMMAAIFASANVFAAEISDLMPILKQAKKSINSTLSEIDKDIKAAANGLSGIDLKGDDARKILNGLRKFRPYVVDCAIINADGVKITVEPEEYRQYENADRSSLPHVIELLKTKKPVLSNVYASAEGVNAVSIGYPIFSDKGELLGAVKMLIRHELFLKPLVEDKPCKIWIMQPNGLIIYDPDPEEVGKNIFTDPIFKSFEDLISFSKTVAISNNGAGSYDFYAGGLKDKTLVKKVAVWDTVGLYGTEWRVVAMEIQDPVEVKQPGK